MVIFVHKPHKPFYEIRLQSENCPLLQLSKISVCRVFDKVVSAYRFIAGKRRSGSGKPRRRERKVFRRRFEHESVRGVTRVNRNIRVERRKIAKITEGNDAYTANRSQMHDRRCRTRLSDRSSTFDRFLNVAVLNVRLTFVCVLPSTYVFRLVKTRLIVEKKESETLFSNAARHKRKRSLSHDRVLQKARATFGVFRPKKPSVSNTARLPRPPPDCFYVPTKTKREPNPPPDVSWPNYVR